MSIEIEALPTPCLVVDRQKLKANLDFLYSRARNLSVRLRPHLKTVKSLEVVKLALTAPDDAVTVSTLLEAEMFAQAGYRDILYAVAITPQKLDRVFSLLKRGVDVKVVIDSVEMAEIVTQRAAEAGLRLPVVIEVDVDGHRSGVPRDRKDLLTDIACSLEGGGAFLYGVMTHAGESYALSGPLALEKAAEEERLVTVEMAETLRAQGFSCPNVSIGSTPTALSARNLDGVTELRAGVYMFFDLVQAGIGVCAIADIALSVLTTVIGRRDDKQLIITDSGWMAMSADRGTADQAVDQYFGLVCDEDGRVLDDLVLSRVNQEHGIISVRPGSAARMPAFPIGTRLRILPNHACATGAQHERYHVVEGRRVTDIWERFRGW